MLVIQLYDIIVIHLLVDATLALCIHPVVLCHKLILADDLLDHVQVGLLVLHQGDHRGTQRLIIEQLVGHEAGQLFCSLVQTETLQLLCEHHSRAGPSPIAFIWVRFNH